MTDKKSFDINYRQTIYFDAARMYAKKACKECYGRGYHKYIAPDNQENYSYCSCAEKNMKKYG